MSLWNFTENKDFTYVHPCVWTIHSIRTTHVYVYSHTNIHTHACTPMTHISIVYTHQHTNLQVDIFLHISICVYVQWHFYVYVCDVSMHMCNMHIYAYKHCISFSSRDSLGPELCFSNRKLLETEILSLHLKKLQFLLPLLFMFLIIISPSVPLFLLEILSVH